jgi:hypothetical protein
VSLATSELGRRVSVLYARSGMSACGKSDRESLPKLYCRPSQTLVCVEDVAVRAVLLLPQPLLPA